LKLKADEVLAKDSADAGIEPESSGRAELRVQQREGVSFSLLIS